MILSGAEALPVTRLIRGTRFALGLVWASWRIGRELSPLQSDEPPTDDSVEIFYGDFDAIGRELAEAPVRESYTLWQAFEQLDPRGRDLLRMVAVTPATSYAAIAECMGIPVSQISSLRARYMEQLKQLMADADQVDPDC